MHTLQNTVRANKVVQAIDRFLASSFSLDGDIADVIHAEADERLYGCYQHVFARHGAVMPRLELLNIRGALMLYLEDHVASNLTSPSEALYVINMALRVVWNKQLHPDFGDEFKALWKRCISIMVNLRAPPP